MKLIHENSKQTIELHLTDEISIEGNVVKISACGIVSGTIECLDKHNAEMIGGFICDLFRCGWDELWVHEYEWHECPEVEYLMYE